MREELKVTFDNLPTNDKRNELSNEIIVISEIINKINEKLGIESNLIVKNYDSNNETTKTEDDMLTFFYEDIYNIKRELLVIYSNINNNE